LATIDQMLGGRLTINIISSDLPGETLASGPRYRRTVEAMALLRAFLNGESVDFDGEFWKLKLDPPRIRPVSGRAPPFYFGGLSEDAREAAAQGADVYLMWPDRLDVVRDTIAELKAYQDLGIEAFILSGYPHQAEADLFARHVLPRLAHGPLEL